MHGGLARWSRLQPHGPVLLGDLQRDPRDVRMTVSEQRLALAMAGVLRRSWAAEDVVPVAHPETERERWVQRLIDGGVGGLAWLRLRKSAFADAPGLAPLRSAFQHHALTAARQERDLPHLLAHFNAEGIEPILFKGWTLARLYPHRALRPFGDFDLLGAGGRGRASAHRPAVPLVRPPVTRRRGHRDDAGGVIFPTAPRRSSSAVHGKRPSAAHVSGRLLPRTTSGGDAAPAPSRSVAAALAL